MNLLIFITIAVLFHVVKSQKIVCYYGTWATYRPENGKFDVANIDPFKCTHLIYSFIGLQRTGLIKLLDPNLDLENIKKFNALKKLNPSLKTLVAIGGWNEGSAKFSQLAKDPDKRSAFAKEARDFLLKHGYDGLDVDWEYPGQRDGDVNVDKQNFVLLLQDIRAAFSAHNLLLTAAVAASEWSASQSYNIPKIAAVLDQIHLMAYDFAGTWNGKTGFNAPISEVDKAVKYWTNQGAPKSKLVLGIPFYGRSFTLSTADNGVGAVISGAGTAGPYSREAGSLGFNEICEQIVAKKWTVRWDKKQSVPFAFNGNQWVSYDDIRSIGAKTAYVVNNGLAGAMVWSIETDDFQNTCGLGKFPLLTTINDGLSGKHTLTTVPMSITGIPQTQSPATRTTPASFVEPVPGTSSSTLTTTLGPLQVNFGRSLMDVLIFLY